MLEILGRATQLCDGVTRRGFLRLGSLGLAGLSLPNLLRAREKPPVKSVILYWLAGGPSHLDTYDLKPSAPVEIRGPFQPIATSVPGLQLCELLPRQARLADLFALVRSIAHRHGVHDDASHWVQTGYPLLNARQNGQRHPAQGAVVSHLRGANRAGSPPYVCIPDAYNSAKGFYQRAAFLGPQHEPVNGGGDPAYGKFRPPELALTEGLTVSRVEDRRELLHRLENAVRQTETTEQFRGRDQAFHRALELVTGPRVREAFDLDREPSVLRDKYGRHSWGRSALLARRLVEAGVTFVTVNHYEADVDWWDDHYDIEKNLRRRLPLYDQALASLIEDLHDRGLGQDVLVVACGEFGRSPYVDKLAGRGHWPSAMSVLLAGGGVRGGRVVGATTSNGGEPRDRPLGPGDLLATIYHALGIDSHATLTDRERRPVRLIETGEPIHELF